MAGVSASVNGPAWASDPFSIVLHRYVKFTTILLFGLWTLKTYAFNLVEKKRNFSVANITRENCLLGRNILDCYKTLVPLACFFFFASPTLCWLLCLNSKVLVAVVSTALRRMVTELTDLTGLATVSLLLFGVLSWVTSTWSRRNPKSIILFMIWWVAKCSSFKESLRKPHPQLAFPLSCQWKGLGLDIHSMLESIPTGRGHALLMHGIWIIHEDQGRLQILTRVIYRKNWLTSLSCLLPILL